MARQASLLAKRLKGKVAIITGAAGIGAAPVRLFAALHGATVVIGDIQTKLGEALAEELGSKAHYMHCDVSQEKDVGAMDFAVEGGLYIMYNNAGTVGPPSATIGDMKVEDMDFVYSVRGALSGTKHAARVMIPPPKRV